MGSSKARILGKLPIITPMGIEKSEAKKNPTPTLHKLATVSFRRSPLLHNLPKASKTLPGDGKNFGSTLMKVVTNHHSSNGKAIDVRINPVFKGLGMSSASRQKTVGFRLFGLR
ncbi:hypothetical protein OSCI_4020041 [Kamptonema sp. PCC 6506]|nr:hypothetical protein OSCI_4020041 [Kamptonema sp. PCC 6506]